MTTYRHFLDWDRPVVSKVTEYLLAAAPPGPVNLENQLVVVPTRQAGRQLRSSLVRACNARGDGLFPPRIITPAFFINLPQNNVAVPAAAEELAIWIDLLLAVDCRDFPGLFPVLPPDQDSNWALHTAETLIRLRSSLLEGGLGIGDIPRRLGDLLPETERWQDLARLETLYCRRLEELGLADSCHLKLASAEAPALPPEVQAVILAAVPDPVPLVVKILGRVGQNIKLTVLVHAPPDLAAGFDQWGRPRIDFWLAREINIPSPEQNVLLAESPSSQSLLVQELVADETARFGPGDIVIGVPDSEVTPYLVADLTANGMPAFDPTGIPGRRHPLYHLLALLNDLVHGGSYETMANLLRHADLAGYLEDAHKIDGKALLIELDTFQNGYLPLDLDDVLAQLLPEQSGRYTLLKQAATCLDGFRKLLTDSGPLKAIRHILQQVYNDRQLDPGRLVDREFTEAAEKLAAILIELGSPRLQNLGLEPATIFSLLLHRFADQDIYPDREDAVIDLDGWLELPWTEAPFLIVTGMNEGKVPDSQLGNPFIPDTMKRRLGLRHDQAILARDIYMMSGLIEARRQRGRTCFICGKNSVGREPLKPARLFFFCSDRELLARARDLFGPGHDFGSSPPKTVSFRLDVAPPPETSLALQKISVSGLRDYLDCPFRYYLKHLLKMAELHDCKEELDAMDFGSLTHDVLEAMGRDAEIAAALDERVIADFLLATTDKLLREKFRFRPALPVLMQVEAIKQRLRAAAGVQAELNRQGWRIIRTEESWQLTLAGVTVSGRIDRIDRHLETGAIRIIDYKTADKPRTPQQAHLGSPRPEAPTFSLCTAAAKTRQWLDLQLPLYHLMLQAEYPGSCSLGFFNLCRAAGDTGLLLWDDFSDELLESALACAGAILDGIKARRFWPPNQVRHDEFSRLFPGKPADMVMPGGLESGEE